MSGELSGMVDGKRIVATDGLPVPAAPNSSCPGDHFFANCLYAESMASKARPELLEDAREDALEMLRRVTTLPQARGCVSAVMTVYGQFPVPGAARAARRRIYRLGVLRNDWPSNSSQITRAYVSNLSTAEESSELEDIAELLHQPAQ
jgi:hypothetical protein